MCYSLISIALLSLLSSWSLAATSYTANIEFSLAKFSKGIIVTNSRSMRQNRTNSDCNCSIDGSRNIIGNRTHIWNLLQ
ncbi:uncharacterized protein EI90DRAFT_2636171 [Cantharellus anzutake]|uniref:uncharacterized protein n=1 Tax=Cantharellus anzutake TaxID=1750568 RepID=UPI0019052933|nr:uncharacterized protein EI90DRAFT_2636171 [Cantharellus anzutake]KAF8337327.1 hypothetical protein EI90DRAFT_2636171 [Cantharellus anzutake]